MEPDEIDSFFERHDVVRIQDIVDFIQEKLAFQSFSSFDKSI
jgi:hypothetical protein